MAAFIGSILGLAVNGGAVYRRPEPANGSGDIGASVLTPKAVGDASMKHSREGYGRRFG